MKYALFLPLFDAFADPGIVAQLAAEAEECGWDGVFVWDHIAYREPVSAVGDPWVTLAAMACSTERIRLGPMVTPLPRRRPVVLARQIASVDVLSRGRLVLGVGTGGDGAGELSATGEELDDRVRGDMLDEGLAVLRAAWTGERVEHRGEHYVVDGLTVLPTPVQRPGPPVWVGARYGRPKPLRRAAGHDGVFPIEIETPEQLAEVVADVRRLRLESTSPYDVVVGGPPGTDPAPFEKAGATWWTVSFSPYGLTVDTVRGVLRGGPAYSSG
jgi:alkanesulfonate monooxygenase SsuD/methylene tetrahydromethanopterin reductase-like flavin-dependent oxidoreductase (luciferase family)